MEQYSLLQQDINLGKSDDKIKKKNIETHETCWQEAAFRDAAERQL